MCQTKSPRLLCQLRLLLQTLLRQKLDNARAGGPNDSTTDADVIGPHSEELHAPSLNGTNGHAAPAVEVRSSISTAKPSAHTYIFPIFVLKGPWNGHYWGYAGA